MKHSIKRAAVIGAGTMGRQIAAVIANADLPVLLLDIVPKGANDRDMLAKKAIDTLKEPKRALVSGKKAALIEPGNMEDDLDKLAQADWIIECVPEAEDIKRDTYKKLGRYAQESALISSNTSTIPLSALKHKLNDALKKQLCITHFFNPPAQMPLLELVTDQDNDPDAVSDFIHFADEVLGRSVVMAHDTPGFIANRIGLFWMLCGMEEAKREHIPIETADAIMNGAFGFPKTGIFALADLIGLKLIPDLAESMCRYFPEYDAFCQLEGGLSLVRDRIAANQEKTAPGFYRREAGKVQVIDLESGEYRDRLNPDIEIRHWHEFLEQDTAEGRFAVRTLARLLSYTTQIAPEIADTIVDIDAALHDGYGWQYGPFEMIDRLGPSWLVERMDNHALHPSLLLKQVQGRFYPHLLPVLPHDISLAQPYMAFDGKCRERKIPHDKWTLALRTAGYKPILDHEMGRVWNIGDDIACLEITTRMGILNEQALELIVQAIEEAESGFAGLVIGHDGRHFSAGLDLNIIAGSASSGNWGEVEAVLKQGQDTMQRVSGAKVPVVPAIHGYTLGGACELTMHCAAVQAHNYVRIGLVETGIGVIPGWGGTKEHLLRIAEHKEEGLDAVVDRGLASFRQIATAKKSINAEDAFSMQVLAEPSSVTMNRQRLLPDAKALCLIISEVYQPREPEVIEVPVATLHARFLQEAEAICEGNLQGHRFMVLRVLAEALSGKRALNGLERKGEPPPRAGWDRLSEQQLLNSERAAFMELVQMPESLEAIEAVLKE